MRPTLLSLAAAGNSPWAPINYLQLSFAIGLGGIPTSGAVLTYSVQHTFDDPLLRRLVSITRSGTTATVVDPDHRLSVGDSVIVSGSGDPNLDSAIASASSRDTVGGQPIPYDVASVVDANTYTYTVANTGATVASPNTYLNSLRVLNHATMAAITARADGNYQFPPQAVRLKVTSYTSGKVDLYIVQGLGR